MKDPIYLTTIGVDHFKGKRRVNTWNVVVPFRGYAVCIHCRDHMPGDMNWVTAKVFKGDQDVTAQFADPGTFYEDEPESAQIHMNGEVLFELLSKIAKEAP